MTWHQGVILAAATSKILGEASDASWKDKHLLEMRLGSCWLIQQLARSGNPSPELVHQSYSQLSSLKGTSSRNEGFDYLTVAFLLP